jgi:hypothetical protein
MTLKAEIMEEISDLERVVWSFIWWDERDGVMLDRWSLEERQSKRHKFKPVGRWSRQDTRDNNVVKPQVSAELAWQAMQKIRHMIKYSKKDRSE